MFKALLVGSLLLNGISGQETQLCEPGMNGCPAVQEWHDDASAPYESPFEQREPGQCEVWRSIHIPQMSQQSWDGWEEYISVFRDRYQIYKSELGNGEEAGEHEQNPEDISTAEDHKQKIRELRFAYGKEVTTFLKWTTHPRALYEVLEPLMSMHGQELKAAKKCHQREIEDLLNSALGSKRWSRLRRLRRRHRSHLEELVKRHTEEICLATQETFFN